MFNPGLIGCKPGIDVIARYQQMIMAGSFVQQARPSEDTPCFRDHNFRAVLGIFLDSQGDADPEKTAAVIGQMIGCVMFAEIFQIVPDGFGVSLKAIAPSLPGFRVNRTDPRNQ